jgi:hypothetical protein
MIKGHEGARMIAPRRYRIEVVTREEMQTVIRIVDTFASQHELALAHDHYLRNTLRRVEGVKSPTLRKVRRNKAMITGMIAAGRAIARLERRSGKG